MVNKAPSPSGIWLGFFSRLVALYFQLQKVHPVISELLLHAPSQEDRLLPSAERDRNLLTATGVVVSSIMKPDPWLPAASAIHVCVLQNRTTFLPRRVIVDVLWL